MITKIVASFRGRRLFSIFASEAIAGLKHHNGVANNGNEIFEKITEKKETLMRPYLSKNE